MEFELLKTGLNFFFMTDTNPCAKKKRFYNRETIELCNTSNVFHTPLSFYATQIINPFLNSRISANHDKVDGLQSMVKSL